MDQSAASIISALITATASIIVALIGRSASGGSAGRNAIQIAYAIPSGNRRAWTTFITILCLWLMLSPFLVHPDWGGINFFSIFVVTFILSMIWPIKPSWAAAIVLALHSINFFLKPFAWSLEGVKSIYRAADFVFLLGFPFANAAVALAIVRWRGRQFVETINNLKTKDAAVGELRSARISLADELSKLKKLHESGALSDEEFHKAKNQLIEG